MTKNNTDDEIQLNDYRKVTLDFYKLILATIELNFDKLKSGVSYKMENLCGKEFWSSLSSGDRKLAGMVAVHITKHGILDLEDAKQPHEYPKYYQLK